MRFFKKIASPSLDAVLSNGAVARFKSIDGGTWGYLATQNENLINEFLRLMAENSGGISEISAEEFTADYLDKKKAGLILPPKQLVREELSGRGLIGLAAQAKGVAAASPAAAPVQPAAAVIESPPAPAQSFKPRLGRKGGH